MMSSGRRFLFATLLFLPACSGGDDQSSTAQHDLNQNGTGGLAAVGAGGFAAGDGSPLPVTGPGGSSAVMPAGAGGSSFNAPGAAGSAPTAPGASDPVVPQVTADCPQFVDGTITFMGLGGIQIAAGPKPPGPTAPMLFYWHGTGLPSSGFTFMAADIAQGVIAEGGVIVSFQNTTGGDLLSGTLIFGEGDLDLADQLLACAVRDHNVDPRRVYTSGCSAGGLFADAMAALRSSYIAAAASNSGGWVVPVTFENNYTPALMTMHGAPGVDVVIVDFSQTSASADDGFKSRGGFVINCNTGGGHCGAAGLAGDAWKFFQAHPYGVDPEPWTSLPAGFSSQCQIY